MKVSGAVYLTRTWHVSSPAEHSAQWTWWLPAAEVVVVAVVRLCVLARRLTVTHCSHTINSSSGARPVAKPNTSTEGRTPRGTGRGGGAAGDKVSSEYIHSSCLMTVGAFDFCVTAYVKKWWLFYSTFRISGSVSTSLCRWQLMRRGWTPRSLLVSIDE